MAQTNSSMLRKRLGSTLVSLKLTVRELVGAVRERNTPRAVALLREGSPLESAISGILYVTFVALLFAPVVILPAYYLLLAVA